MSSSNESGNLPAQSPVDDSSTSSPLHAATKMADIVRSSLNNNSSNKDEKNDFRLTPGLLEGTLVGAVTLLVLTPVRSTLLRVAGNRLGIFPDLVLTTSQIMVASNAALYCGSLYGSHFYLTTFAQIPAQAVSPTVDGICRRALSDFGPFYQHAVFDDDDDDDAQQGDDDTKVSSSSSSSWDPNAIVLADFVKAMKLCRERSSLQQQQQQQPRQQQQ